LNRHINNGEKYSRNMVKVRHKVWGSPESRERFKKPKCKCRSWIQHWDENRKEGAARRCVGGCGKVFCGAHVSKIGSDRSHYIVPYCRGNWGKGSAIENVPANVLVPVDASSCKNRSSKPNKKTGKRKTTNLCKAKMKRSGKVCKEPCGGRRTSYCYYHTTAKNRG
jgi:hypothetical protein